MCGCHFTAKRVKCKKCKLLCYNVPIIQIKKKKCTNNCRTTIYNVYRLISQSYFMGLIISGRKKKNLCKNDRQLITIISYNSYEK